VKIVLDSDLYAELWNLIQDIEGAQSTWFGSAEPGGSGASAEDYPIVWLLPLGWTEADQVDPVDPQRTCTFEIRVVAAGQGGYEQYQVLDRLAAAVLSQIRGSDLGGLALPGLTSIESGRVERKYPYEGHHLAGSFSYLPDEDPA
jgi:hypothetical protein